MNIEKKYIVIFILLVVSLNIFSSNKTYLKNKGVIIDFKKYKISFGIGFKTSAFENIKSFKKGVVNRYSNDPNNKTNLGKFVEIKVNDTNIEYFIIYAMLSEINKNLKENKLLSKDEIIGKSGPSGPLTKIVPDSHIFIAVYTFEKDKSVEKMSGGNSFSQFGVFWYNPSFIINKKTTESKKEKYDESKYKKIELKQFLDFFDKSPGTSYFGLTFYNMTVQIQNMPTKINETDLEKIKEVHRNAKVNSKESINMYKYKMTLTYPAVVKYRNECKLNLYIQSELVPFIKNEYKINDSLKINFIISYIDTFNQEASLLVTGIGY